MVRVCEELGVSERRACRVLGPARSSQRHGPVFREDEDALTRAILHLARQYGRYGYRRITALLLRAGWPVNHKRVERIWRQEGLKVPQKQPQRGRLWLQDGSCVRLRPCGPNHVWAYDFVLARTQEGRAFRLLTVIDEYTRECLAIGVARQIRSDDVLDLLAKLFALRGTPEHLRSDNGPEFCAQAVRNWLGRVGVKTLFIEPGSPWENGYNESFNLPAAGRRQAAGRAAEPGDLLHPPGGEGAGGAVAADLQQGSASQCSRVPSSSSGGHRNPPR